MRHRAAAYVILAALSACHEPRQEPAAQPPRDLSRQTRVQPDEWTSTFGAAVAIDGPTLVVGAPGPRLGHGPGGVFVFERQPAGWKQLAKLVAAPGESCEQLGRAVAISGNILIAGGDACAVVFERNGSAWDLRRRVVGTTKEPSGFGERVGVSGETVFVADEWSDVGEQAGAGFVAMYRRDGGTWTPAGQLTESPPRWAAAFGSDLAISGTTIAVGARQAKSTTGVDAVGALHLFERDAKGWTASFDFAPAKPEAFSTVGHSVAIDHDVALAGSQGQRRAFAFARRNGAWQADGTLDAPAPATGRDNFAAALAVQGATAAITAIPLSTDDSIPTIDGVLDHAALANRKSARAATVFVYQRGNDGWHNVTALTHTPPTADDEFGRALAISADALVVGAPGSGDVTIFGAR